jgi:hypothetical protein
MSADLVEYNGYRFNEYSECTINAVMQDDDASRTTIYHRYKLRVETTIYAEDNDLPVAGGHFDRIRDRLTKKGQALIISHRGFSESLFDVNVYEYGRRDVTFGPHPRVVSWDPVGHENAVHVVWECDFCLSACNRWSGIMAANYQMSTRVDIAGYTTRTINGYIEIAMTRINQRFIPDTADAYRDQIIVGQMPNFQRETSWHLSSDKRRADFTIVDSEIRSPNAFAPGIINITANHGANWSRRQSAILPQVIRATIELAQGQPRSRAWEVFRAIVLSRLQFAAVQAAVFLENLNCDESLFSNTFNFSINYRTFVQPNASILSAIAGMFQATGIGAPLNLGTWQQWKASVSHLQSHRGQANLQHSPAADQIVDLCAVDFLAGPVTNNPSLPRTPMPLSGGSLYNQKPSPQRSYLRYETWMDYEEDSPTSVQISVDPEDLKYKEFDPQDPEATIGETDSGTQVKRFIETQAGSVEVSWRGYAERVGYPVPRPDKIQIGGVTMTRIGRAQFRQKFVGNVLGQPVYAAAWNQRYVVTNRPEKMDTNDVDDWEL